MKRLSVVSAAVAIGLSGCNLAHDGLHAIVDGVQAGQQAIGVHNNVNVSIAGTYRVTYETPDGASTFYTRTRSVPEAPLVNFTTYSDGSTHYELTGGYLLAGLAARTVEELPGNYRSRYRRDGFGMFIVMETEPGVGQDPDVVGTFNFLLVDREDPILMDLVDHMRNDQGDTDEDLFESGAVTVFNRADGLLRAERNYEVDGVPVRATIEQVSTVAY